ncbi:MAG: ABC transporter ATP-binding protein [Candidatus Eisenbacteria bacterium]|nr:ABC transporter ATP-binding protein [Candidatus Eisenbacteria bacterium]
MNAPGDLGGFRRLWPHFAPYVRRERTGLALAALASVGLTASELLQPWPLKLVFDYALKLPRHGSVRGPLAPLAAWTPDSLLLLSAGILLAAAALSGLFGYGQTFFLSRAGQRIVTSLRERMFDHLQRLSLAFHRGSRTGDLLVRLTGDVNVLSDVLVEASMQVAGRLTLVVGMLTVMFLVDAPLTLAAVSVLPFMAWVVHRYSRRIRQAARSQRRREGAIASRAGEAIAHIALVKAFSREAEEGRRFSEESRAVLDTGVRASRLQATMQRGVEVLVAAGTGAVLWFGVHRVIAGRLTPGDLLVFTAYLKQMYRPIRDMAVLVNRLSKAHACAERVADILESEPEAEERPGLALAPRLRGEVAYEAVGFSYRDGEPVVRDVSFRVPAGARVAVVGPTGSGKSTLVGMLARFHEPRSGRVTVDGHDLRSFTLRSVREQVSLVLQEPMLFGGTLRDNIAYGRLEATQAEIEAAARAAQIHEFIESLPEGYDTAVSERGATLSGGQKQRLAVARAILRDAPLLILDEPTTGLDAESEAAVHAALQALSRGRTTFLITHRLATVANADLIVVLEDGRLAGAGSHAELLGTCDLYRRLVNHELAGHGTLVG